MAFKPKHALAIFILSGLMTSPALAQSLLGGVLGGDGGGGLLSVDSGPAGSDSTVNVGVGDGGSGSGGILSLNLGGGSSGGLASAGLTGGDGLNASGSLLGGGVNADLNLLNGGGSLLNGGVDLAGLGLDVDLDLGLGLGGSNGNNDGQNGQNGQNGFGAGGSGGSTGFAGLNANCSIAEGRRVLELAAAARVNPRGWQRASAIQVVPVRLCPATRKQVAGIFRTSSKVVQLQSAAASDPLIAASLNRTRYSAGNVFAVDGTGGALTVYVY